MLDNKHATKNNIKWGTGYRNVVVIFQGKKYQYKEVGDVNKILMKSISPLYIKMSSKLQITIKTDDSENKKIVLKNKTKEKNNYVQELTAESINLNNSTAIKSVSINLTQITIKAALTLILNNVNDRKLALKLSNNKYYFLNDHTINNLMKGLLDENAIVNSREVLVGGAAQGEGSDAEFVEYFTTIDTLELVALRTPKDKTKPGGGFFRYYNNTKFDLKKYDIYCEIDDPNYKENCLIIAFRQGGMLDDQLQMIKLFIMNRIIPKCKLKDICNKLQISIKLTSMNAFMISRTETFGDNKHKQYHLGLIDDHYFIIDLTNITSYCLKNYEGVKHIDNCNMIYCKCSNKYKTSNKEYIDSF